MSRILSIAEARKRLAQLPDELTQYVHPEGAIITDNGASVLAILPWELYDGMLETLEILGNFQQMAALCRGMQDIAEGRTETWETVKARLRIAITREQQA
ncbi:MAG TPA: type II toxin-antitoxin system Phd/YefM family antitoxin [Ktedonobacterales bacterium]|jgi:PHD/YefM family antitoxin component YafN of YafNO toxin-antitoxin module|nr:type II toxin-antitoxin system Phd/YefM family antitoxin [Ktedonobacterales bacterium]